ncbi:UDP-N-acetylmuramoyl-L-alanyl-D-glutamate--2,6-diaminopimelate ligase [Rhodospirillaceae bacterium SYSU D60014]|uniref:UDP-N-acetylmuramoyl-L-alanyl-D-glutamate--2, 6-diaminopimelate ligase n=1 Tax=Virgifigura deserti TaxID=2268457 RepID=UPI000E65FAF9
MLLNDLVSDLVEGERPAVQIATPAEQIDVQGLTADSRQVQPGWLFAALPGSRADGRGFIDDAVGRGAVAVLAASGTHLKPYDRPVALVTDDNPRRRLALLAARFHPSQPRVVAAVTGTSGKTSVASFARQLWTLLGHRAGSLGTLGVVAPGFDAAGSLTTPDPVALHRCLDALAGGGIDHLALEASSHGLEQYRLDGVRITAAAFTNLSRDHLDYHQSMDAYLAAKLRLFDALLPPDAGAVLNADMPEYEQLSATCHARGLRILSYGCGAVDIRLEDRVPVAEGQQLTIGLFGRRHRILLPLTGAFQAHNALCALGLVIAGGEDAASAVAALERLTGVHGRIELVARHPNGAPVYVDYAHKPDALETVLKTLRPHAKGRLVVVFGCGGDRDRGKRPLMGAIAAAHADRVIVTDDNPRSEDPTAIRAEILAACPQATEIGDRAEAIRAAITRLAPDDLLVIAGKGHESGQTVAGVTHPFDDSDVARSVASAMDADGKSGGGA